MGEGAVYSAFGKFSTDSYLNLSVCIQDPFKFRD